MNFVKMPLALGEAPNGVLAMLTIAATPDGDVTVGYDVRDLVTKEPLALGCGPPCATEDLAGLTDEALRSLLQAVASLLDWDPFDPPAS